MSDTRCEKVGGAYSVFPPGPDHPPKQKPKNEAGHERKHRGAGALPKETKRRPRSRHVAGKPLGAGQQPVQTQPYTNATTKRGEERRGGRRTPAALTADVLVACRCLAPSNPGLELSHRMLTGGLTSSLIGTLRTGTGRTHSSIGTEWMLEGQDVQCSKPYTQTLDCDVTNSPPVSSLGRRHLGALHQPSRVPATPLFHPPCELLLVQGKLSCWSDVATTTSRFKQDGSHHERPTQLELDLQVPTIPRRCWGNDRVPSPRHTSGTYP